jgi:hypothetical protein
MNDLVVSHFSAENPHCPSGISPFAKGEKTERSEVEGVFAEKLTSFCLPAKTIRGQIEEEVLR